MGRSIGSRIEVNANYFESRPERGSLTTALTGTVRETFSPRFSLLQLVTRSDGQFSAAWGGEFLTNRVKVNADYQNVYLPFRPGRPFEQALALNVALQVYGPWLLSGATNVGPDGHLRYTFGVTTFLYRQSGFGNSQDQNRFSFPKYVLQGVVRDSDGSPLPGVALHFGKELAFTDDGGRFLVRFRKRGPFAVQVSPAEFLIPGVFEVVKAPTSLLADPENSALDVEIVIRKVKPEPTPTPAPTTASSAANPANI